MRKPIKILAISVMGVGLLMGCGSSVVQLNLTDTVATASAEVSNITTMNRISANELASYYNVSPTEYIQFSGLLPGIGTSADEIVIIEAVDSQTATIVYEAAQARLADKLRQAEGYLPEEYAIIEQGIVRKDGNYVALFVTPDVDAVVAAYERQLTQ